MDYCTGGMFVEMKISNTLTYNEFINNILKTRGRFACGDEYHERHHIVPRCTGGTDDENNLIDLFAKEHFEAHRLLALENPDNAKLIYAWWCMSIQTNQYTKERYQVTAEEYEEIKKKYSVARSESMCGENHPLYGTHLSEETKQKISTKLKEFFLNSENHPMYGKHMSEESKEKSRISHLGKNASDETKRKMSEKRRGADNSASKSVIQFDINGNYIHTWEYATMASNTLNIDLSSIIKCCRGKRNKAGGFIWCYTDEVLVTN